MNLLHTFVAACASLAGITVLVGQVQAQPVVDAYGRAARGAQGGLAARSGATVQGNRGLAARQQAVVADGQGNVNANGSAGFATQNGSHGTSTGSYTHNADGTASAGRSTTATNGNTGVTLDASTTYTQGSGVSRSASCKDAAGNTVACGSR
jgi:hypothetical protein